MLKIFGRVLVILSVSCALAAAMYAIVKRNTSGTFATNRTRGFEGRGMREAEFPSVGPTDDFSGRPAEFHAQGAEHRSSQGGRPSEHGLRGNSLSRGFFGLLRSVLVISLITLLVIGTKRIRSSSGKCPALWCCLLI